MDQKEPWLRIFEDLKKQKEEQTWQYKCARLKAKWCFVHELLTDYLVDKYPDLLNDMMPYTEEWNFIVNKVTVAECGIKFIEDEGPECEDILCNEFYDDSAQMDQMLDHFDKPNAWMKRLTISMIAWFLMCMTDYKTIESVEI